MSNMFEEFFSTPEVLDAFGERNFVAAMLRFEAALARAQGAVGLIPESAAQSIIGTCKVDLFDVAKILRESSRAGSVATPLIANLKETVGLFNRDAVAFVHFGSTSQDVVDTALALVTRDVLDLIEADVSKTVAASLALANRHAATPVLVRTLKQPSSVSSFGLKCAGWAAPLVRGRGRLRRAAGRALSVQFGGAFGIHALAGGQGGEVARLMAQELLLSVPRVSWHSQRDEWAALGCELGLLTGSLGKIAKDISLMAQYEVGEVVEPAKHGLNGCMVALTAAQSVPQRVAALLAAMAQEHERPLDTWQVELAEWSHLLMSAHGSARAMAQTLSGLQVDTERMRVHIDGLRMKLPKDVAEKWFAPGLVLQAEQLTTASVKALQDELAKSPPGAAG